MFHPWLNLPWGPAMAIRRVALIYDDRARSETTGVYCLRALRRLVEVEYFQPDELERIPREGFDLFLNIDDGFPYHLPSDLRPCAWWAIDTHVNFEACLDKAPRFDVVFAAQRDGADALRRAGISAAAWLPLACDPEIHSKHEVDKQYDVSFVGNVFPGPRADLLNLTAPDVHQLVYRAVLLRGDGSQLLGVAHCLQPEHQERRQHAGLRGPGVRLAAGHQRAA